MLTTYSDDNGELVVRHYCGLGTEPVFSVSELSDKVMSSNLINQKQTYMQIMKVLLPE